MDQINLAETSLIREADNQIFQIETQTNAAINDTRRQLRDQLAQINLQKGQLEADKATMRINALQNYQLTLRQLEAQKEQSMMQIEANKQSALQNFEFEKALIAERARYSTSGSGEVGDDTIPIIPGTGEDEPMVTTQNTALNRMLQLGFRPSNMSIGNVRTQGARTTDQGVSTGYGF